MFSSILLLGLLFYQVLFLFNFPFSHLSCFYFSLLHLFILFLDFFFLLFCFVECVFFHCAFHSSVLTDFFLLNFQYFYLSFNSLVFFYFTLSEQVRIIFFVNFHTPATVSSPPKSLHDIFLLIDSQRKHRVISRCCAPPSWSWRVIIASCRPP